MQYGAVPRKHNGHLLTICTPIEQLNYVELEHRGPNF
jgi:hypothetical protein